jgi:hypothetical protein
MAQSSPLEDGSTAFYDDQGNLLYIVGRDGTTTNADSSIATSWLQTASQVFQSAIRRDFGLTPAAASPAAPAATAAASSPLSSLQKYLPLALIALVLYKLFA